MLSADELVRIDAFFITDLTMLRTLWNELKADAPNPTLTHLRDLVARQRWLATQLVGTTALATVELARKMAERGSSTRSTTCSSRLRQTDGFTRLSVSRVPGFSSTGCNRWSKRQRGRDEPVLPRMVDKDDVAHQLVTLAGSDSTTRQNVIIDAGRFFH